MRVVHFNQWDRRGGAAIAAHRLHEGLVAAGIDSHLLVGKAEAPGERIHAFPPKTLLSRVSGAAFERAGLGYAGITRTFSLDSHPLVRSADVLNLHNLHGGYFNYLALPALTRRIPAVFTLHDMWAFTGHCAYSFECDRFENGCGRCPHLEAYPPVPRDFTALEWKLKNRAYRRSDLTVVAPSRWLADAAGRSMLGRSPGASAVRHIPYGIDTAVYRQGDRSEARRALGVPPDGPVVMFLAETLSDPRKGGDLLLKAVESLPDELASRLTLLTVGHSGTFLGQQSRVRTVDLGFLADDESKVTAFAAADLLIFPTRADNLPLVLLEALACGVPMVSFRVGGVPDLVRPGTTGLLAEPEDWAGFRDAIVTLLGSDETRRAMARACRDIATAEYSLELQARRYRELYEELLARRAA